MAKQYKGDEVLLFRTFQDVSLVEESEHSGVLTKFNIQSLFRGPEPFRDD